MSLNRRWAVGFAALAGVLISGFARADATGGKKNADAGIAAYINGEPITLAELDAIAIGKNMKLAQSLYDARAGALDQLILNRALSKAAAEQGVSVDALIAKRVAERITPVTDEEVAKYFNSNKARMGSRTLETVGPQIRNYLARNRTQQAKTALIKSIKDKQTIRVVLDVPRVEMTVSADEAAKGPSNAKVTVVEYSDFQ